MRYPEIGSDPAGPDDVRRPGPDSMRNPPEIRDFRNTFDGAEITRHVHRQSARNNPRWVRSLTRAMENHGFSPVGHGLNGAVFRNGNYPFVLKVYRTDDGYDEWLHFARTNRENAYVPRTRGKTVRLNGVFQAVRLEPLVPCPVEKANAFIARLERLKSAFWKGKEERAAMLANADPDLIAVARFLREWEPLEDLTPHNVMCREDGQIVLADPLYGSLYGDE